MRIWVALLVVVCGCAGATGLVRPGLAKKKMWEVRTPHLVLLTDLPQDDASSLGESLEELWLSLADNYELVAPGQSRPVNPVYAVIFRDCEDFKVLRPIDQAAGFVVTSRDSTDRPLIVSCQGQTTQLRALFLHELAHTLNRHFFARLPVWLEEGLAMYYETLQIRRGQVTLGLVPLMAMAFRRDVAAGAIHVGDKAGRMPTLDELMALRGDFYRQAAGGGVAHHYASAWALVHLLNSTQDLQDRFVLLLSRMAAGQRFDAVWEDLYGGARAQLAAAHATYIDRGELMYWRAKYSRPDAAAPAVRRLGPGETHGVWIHLLLAAKGGLDRTHVLAQLDAADKADPAWGGRHFWRAMAYDNYSEEGVDQLLRQAADADPTDRLARLALLRRAIGVDGNEHLAALDADAEILEKRADSALELAVLGVFWGRRDQPKRALPLVGRAINQDRGCAYCYEAAAFTVFKLGNVSQAVTYQQRAVDLIERSERGHNPAVARERLDRYREAAGSTSPPP